MSNSTITIPLDSEILSQTPTEVVEFLLRLLADNQALLARVEELEAKVNRNSSTRLLKK